jgi:hypothetical protein
MKTILCLAFLFFASLGTEACTSIIVSGKYTADGRPLIWKNRDTDHLNNRLMFFKDGKYTYTGLVNSEDIEGNEVWAGMNSAGFCIMNTASYNLDNDPKIRPTDREGEIMKQALQQCATVDEFEAMLKKLPKPLGVEANFGVIDARGGAAYFEVNHFKYVKLDVNDKTIAPNGYIIHTNYSFTGNDQDGMGYIRYMAAESVFSTMAMTNSFTPLNIIQKASRCLKHGLTQIDLNDFSKPGNKTEMFWFTDFIPRTSTSAAILMQGVKEKESPELTTMWLVLGFPLTSVVMPVWNTEKVPLPKILTANEKNRAPLCDMAMDLKSRCFPMKRENGKNYIYLPKMLLYVSEINDYEERILEIEGNMMVKWRESNSINTEELKDFYTICEKLVIRFMEGLQRK